MNPPKHGITAQVGCGADELIDLLLRCVLEPGDAIIDCPPTFGMYAFDTDVCGGRVVDVPRRPDFSLDVPAITAAVTEHSPKVVFLTSPNNPDGSMMPEADLLALLALPVLVVLDEAYIEFSDVGTRMPWVMDVPNLVVLRTFSKSAGLAGLRVGCVCRWPPPTTLAQPPSATCSSTALHLLEQLSFVLLAPRSPTSTSTISSPSRLRVFTMQGVRR